MRCFLEHLRSDVVSHNAENRDNTLHFAQNEFENITSMIDKELKRTEDMVTISWAVEDIMGIREGWTREQCTAALEDMSRTLKDRSVEEGWTIIEDLITILYAKYKVGKPVNGISINGDEWLLNDDNSLRLFESIGEAKQWLRDHGVVHFEGMRFELHEVPPS